MLTIFGEIDNHIALPTPVLDDTTSEGYRLEDRLQVTVKSPINDKTYTVEFRIGEGIDAPASSLLDQWMDATDLVRITCSSVVARPFQHDPAKQYRSAGSVKEINGQTVTLDALIVFAGTSIALASEAFNADEEVRKARGAYRKQQKAYRETVNARRIEQTKAGMTDQVAKLKESQAKRLANGGAPSPGAADPSAPPVQAPLTDTNGTRRR